MKNRFVDLIDQASSRSNRVDVFQDFVELAAISISNTIDINGYEEREERYFQVVNKYDDKEASLFPKMFAYVVEQLQSGYSDVLGQLFMDMELGNKRNGQFFTPYNLCKLMANVQVNDGMHKRIEEKGFTTVNDPACGAGALLIALAEAMKEQGINYQQSLHVTATDIDTRSCHMAYIQLSLLNVPATIIVGNSISLEVRDVFRTPAHIIGFWDSKLCNRIDNG